MYQIKGTSKMWFYGRTGTVQDTAEFICDSQSHVKRKQQDPRFLLNS